MLTRPTPPQVLVVSEDVNVCGPLLEAGEDVGWLIRCSESAAAAESMLVSESALFDALVIDLADESGAGLEAGRVVRGILPELPFIYLTRAWPGRTAQIAVAGGAIVAKPFDPAALIAHIGVMIDQRRKRSR